MYVSISISTYIYRYVYAYTHIYMYIYPPLQRTFSPTAIVPRGHFGGNVDRSSLESREEGFAGGAGARCAEIDESDVSLRVKRSTGYTQTHTPTENNTPDTDTHAHDKNNTPNPQTNTSRKHSTTLEGGLHVEYAERRINYGLTLTLIRVPKSTSRTWAYTLNMRSED